MTIFVVTFNMFCDMVEYDNNEQVTHIRLSAGAAYLCDWHFALLAYAALPFVGRAQMCLFHPTFGQLQQLFLFSITKEGVINSIAHHQLGLLFGEDACIVELLEFLGYCGVRNSHVVGIDTNGNASSQECLKGILRHGGNASDSLGLQVARRTECQTDIFLFQQSLHIVVVPRTNTMTYTLCTIINGKPHALNAIGLTGMDSEWNALFFGLGEERFIFGCGEKRFCPSKIGGAYSLSKIFFSHTNCLIVQLIVVCPTHTAEYQLGLDAA